MDHLIDTASIQPTTVTLTGYQLWTLATKDRILNLKVFARIEFYYNAVKTYGWVAEDLANLVAGPSRLLLLSLLKYYLSSLGTAIYELKDVFENLSNGWTKATKDLFTLTVDGHTNFEAWLLNVENPLTPLPANPNQADRFDIPNYSVLELLVRAKYENSIPRPLTLGAFKNMINTLGFPGRHRARPRVANTPGKPTELGLPTVLFACLGHEDLAGNPIAVGGTSGDHWWSPVSGETLQWRLGRFPNVPIREDLDLRGTVAQRFFDFQKGPLMLDAAYRARATASPPTLTNAELNAIANAVRNTTGPSVQPLMGPNFGINHLREPGRSFHGDGPLLFDEMSRCWKCRFVHHYDTTDPDPNWMPEHPRQTAFIANRGLNCAEDMVSYQCENLMGQAGQPGRLRFPGVPLPLVPPPIA